MPANTLKHLVVATMLMSAAMTASALTTSTFTFTDQDLQGMLAHSQPPQAAQQAKPAEAAATERLRVGLSDPGTQLVLPWFLADLVDAVNRRASPQDFAKKLRDGI
ncbi:hypothetical protein [Ralstonia flatus]|uniref:Uncharacterized protein n=1 Tax=Ralstonia flatus TaxID=3058601 RepID=A0AAD2F7H6_9RALS|nr:hypothetical protein [Ralstonia sp. LMG 32965]MBN6208820.1 hypothetical protein [Ralstonia pickettii]CAJ0853770.1 hypothetical protein R77567_00849 [Ralstonia sp. LMG 32965]CAJ0866046.1 hypothetical protein R77564_01254 [Ralstonia sp. LMG 32965]